MLEDIVECLTVGTCCRKANISGGELESKLTEPQPAAVVSAVLSGVLAVVRFCAEDSARYRLLRWLC
jgi:hypothetical protein